MCIISDTFVQSIHTVYTIHHQSLSGCFSDQSLMWILEHLEN
jgi:hypothetical protein